MKDVTLYAAGRKGVIALEYIKSNNHNIAQVVYAHDTGCVADNADDIIRLCKEMDIPYNEKRTAFKTHYSIAIGWRWMMDAPNLIVFHDSLLPKYRGFAPLVAALINGDKEVGGTVFYACEVPDAGDIIYQQSIKVSYPTKIGYEIERMGHLYTDMLGPLLTHIEKDIPIFSEEQVGVVTQSVWRDALDYAIDWNQSAACVMRFINAVGFPYKGATSLMNGVHVLVHGCVQVPDERIENRRYNIGKVLRLDHGCPVVICARGLLRITEMDYEDNKNALPVTKLKTRFV